MKLYPIKRVLLLSLLLLATHLSWAADRDTLSIFERIENNTPVADIELFSLVYQNPAMQYDRYTSTLNDIYVGYESYKQSQPAIQQLGSGDTNGSVYVTSFIVEGANRLWGNVHYTNGVKQDVYFNETSDYELLYPYVMGDTLGGDLSYEEYYFSGGYGYRTSRYTIGVEGAYRASLSYRDVDPRPKNLVGDLSFSLGASYLLNSNYTVGLALLAHKYKQTNELTFYNVQGVPNIYHFTGLGSDYYRFQGANGNVFYQGYTYGGALNLLPYKAKSAGVTATVQYEHFSFDKILSDLNELPINAVRESNWQGELAWRSNPTNNTKWGTQLLLSNTHRIGSEYIYGTVSGVVYPLISEIDSYSNKLTNIVVAGNFEQTVSPQLSYSILPSIAYDAIATEYVSTQRTMQVDRLQSGITLATRHHLDRWMIRCKAESSYTAVLQNNLSLSTVDSLLDEPVQSAYNYLSANSIAYMGSVRADYMVTPLYTIYASCKYMRSNSEGLMHANYLHVAIGTTF